MLGILRILIWSGAAVAVWCAAGALYIFAVLRTFGVDDALSILEAARPVPFIIVAAVVLLCTCHLASKAKGAALSHAVASTALMYSLYIGLSFTVTQREAVVVQDLFHSTMFFSILGGSVLGYALSRWTSRRS